MDMFGRFEGLDSVLGEFDTSIDPYISMRRWHRSNRHHLREAFDDAVFMFDDAALLPSCFLGPENIC